MKEFGILGWEKVGMVCGEPLEKRTPGAKGTLLTETVFLTPSEEPMKFYRLRVPADGGSMELPVLSLNGNSDGLIFRVLWDGERADFFTDLNMGTRHSGFRA